MERGAYSGSTSLNEKRLISNFRNKILYYTSDDQVVNEIVNKLKPFLYSPNPYMTSEVDAELVKEIMDRFNKERIAGFIGHVASIEDEKERASAFKLIVNMLNDENIFMKKIDDFLKEFIVDEYVNKKILVPKPRQQSTTVRAPRSSNRSPSPPRKNLSQKISSLKPKTDIQK